MALSLSLKVCQDCRLDRLLMYELTGAYSTSNTGGWETPNVAIADVDTATLTLTGHDGTQYDAIDVSSVFPSTDSADVLAITSEDLGLTATTPIPGGIWIADYQVTGISGSTPFNYRARRTFAVLCSVECCVNEKMSEVDPLCGCTSGAQKKNIQAMLALEGIKAAISCGKVSQARSLYDRLVAICNNNCKNC
jgi:hypothetical protein